MAENRKVLCWLLGGLGALLLACVAFGAFGLMNYTRKEKERAARLAERRFQTQRDKAEALRKEQGRLVGLTPAQLVEEFRAAKGKPQRDALLKLMGDGSPAYAQAKAFEKEEEVQAEQAKADAEKAKDEEMKKDLGGRGYKIWKKHPEWDLADIRTISQKKVHLGMTQEQCRESWGAPSDVNNTTGSWGVHSQWCYGEYCSSALYFENGTLTSIQN